MTSFKPVGPSFFERAVINGDILAFLSALTLGACATYLYPIELSGFGPTYLDLIFWLVRTAIVFSAFFSGILFLQAQFVGHLGKKFSLPSLLLVKKRQTDIAVVISVISFICRYLFSKVL